MWVWFLSLPLSMFSMVFNYTPHLSPVPLARRVWLCRKETVSLQSQAVMLLLKTHWHAYARPISERYGTSFRAASPRYASSRYSVQNANHLDISTLVRARHLEKLYKGKLMSLMHSIYPRILHKILTLDRGWTKTHGFFIDMGGFLPFEGDNAKGHGVLSPESGVAHGRKDRVSHCNCGRDRGS